MRSHLQRLVLAAFSSVAVVVAAHGQAIVRYIDDPLPEELKGRVIALLRSMRANDFDQALANTKIIDDDSWRKYDQLFLRVESGCKTYCMTMIARVTDHTLVPELTLIAGKAVLFDDAATTLWRGKEASFGISFEGSAGSALKAFEWDGRWFVGACGECRTWGGDSMVKPPERPPLPQTNPQPQNYEEFRRALGLEP